MNIRAGTEQACRNPSANLGVVKRRKSDDEQREKSNKGASAFFPLNHQRDPHPIAAGRMRPFD
jgi:hypothetical protein